MIKAQTIDAKYKTTVEPPTKFKDDIEKLKQKASKYIIKKWRIVDDNK